MSIYFACHSAKLTETASDFIFPPNDPVALRAKLIWLQNHPTEGMLMGKAGRQRVLDRFTWSAVVERCLTAYRSCAS